VQKKISVTINFIVLKLLSGPYQWYYSFIVERSHVSLLRDIRRYL